MTEDQKFKLFNKLIYESEIQKMLRLGKLDSYRESYNNDSSALEEKINEGWNVDVILKSKTKVFKIKPNDISFEGKVWALFAQLGFKLMNKDRHFHLPYDKKDDSLTQQIDVLLKMMKLY